MSNLLFTSVGPATSIQDGGRFGTQRYGLPPSGAMDRIALAIANALVGNPSDGAAIEVGPLGMKAVVRDGPVRVALAGAARQADVSGLPMPLNQTVLIAEGETLNLGPARKGVFSYLGVEGGLRGEPMFGSLSVNARSEIGDPFPRPLRDADEVVTGTASLAAHERQLDISEPTPRPIRVVLGPQDDEFGGAVDTLLSSEWVISAISDRMGYRLEGPKIEHPKGHNIVSDGTVNGSIQVPGSGQPIVLMMDRGTTGGYPKIATVISSDLSRFAQMPAGSRFRFAAISVKEAQDEAVKLSMFLKSLPGLVRPAGSSNLNVDELQRANVAGVAVNAIDVQSWQDRRIGTEDGGHDQA